MQQFVPREAICIETETQDLEAVLPNVSVGIGHLPYEQNSWSQRDYFAHALHAWDWMIDSSVIRIQTAGKVERNIFHLYVL